MQVLKLCQKAGLTRLGHVALDGATVKTCASKHKAMSYGRMQTTEAALAEEVRGGFDTAGREDAEEDRRLKASTGEESPDRVAKKQTRLTKVRNALEAETRAAQGNRRDDDPPPPPTDAFGALKDTVQRNFTDPGS